MQSTRKGVWSSHAKPLRMKREPAPCSSARGPRPFPTWPCSRLAATRFGLLCRTPTHRPPLGESSQGLILWARTSHIQAPVRRCWLKEGTNDELIVPSSTLLSSQTSWGSSHCSPVHPGGAPLKGCWHASFPTRRPGPRAEMSSFRFPPSFPSRKPQRRKDGRRTSWDSSCPFRKFCSGNGLGGGLWEPTHREMEVGGGWMAWGPVAGP